jgi:isopenicillin N synthase-like dioxygenase
VTYNVVWDIQAAGARRRLREEDPAGQPAGSDTVTAGKGRLREAAAQRPRHVAADVGWGRTRSWPRSATRPQSFVINVGDLLARWTNGTWVSAVHRVVHPADGGGHGDRYSIALFHQPDPDAVVECIPSCLESGATRKYPPVTFGEYLAAKVRQAHIHRLIGRR